MLESEEAIDNLDGVLSQAMADYHSATVRGDGAAQEAHLRWICAAMSRLLGARLRNDEKWSRWHRIDGILPTAVLAHSQTECEVRGFVVWGDGSNFSREPFAGSVQVNARAELVAYSLRFADAKTRLGEMSKKDQLAFEAGLANPAEWQFSFSMVFS